MNQKHLHSIHHTYVNVNLMEKCNSDHGGIVINDNVSVKNVMCVKNITIGILLHVVVEMKNI